MTQERFFRILNDPELLANISYEELKTLALAYPYAHNLRYLLALKAHKIEHPEAARTLSAAAMYSLDRTQLFVYMAPKAIVPQKMLEKEEVLELKPIETVRQELEALSPQPREEKPAEVQQSATAPVPVETPIKANPVPVDQEEMQEEVPEVAASPKVENKPVSLPFINWVSQFNPPALEPQPRLQPAETLPKTSKPPALPPEKGVAQKMAERSVSENKDVISETLAKLLIQQGHKEKAILMYERLCLAFPEKSPYFAAEIEKLKN